jgi:hypothetical protein
MRFSCRLIQTMNCTVCEQSICSSDADDERAMARLDRALGATPRVCPSCGRAIPEKTSDADRTRMRLWARAHKK